MTSQLFAHDTELQQAIDDIKAYSVMLASFVDGDSDQTISTGNGNIQTLRGVINSVKAGRVMNVITDFATKALLDADTALVDGDLARVWDDTALNGLYKKASGVWTKTNFKDVFDLRDYAETPWNFNPVIIDDGSFFAEATIFTVELPVTTNSSYNFESLHTELEARCTTSSNEGVTALKHRINIFAGDASSFDVNISIVESDDVGTTGFIGGYTGTVLTVDHSVADSNHIFEFKLTPPAGFVGGLVAKIFSDENVVTV